MATEQTKTYKGLANIGNTCYLGSFLQLLYHATDFRKGLYKLLENPAKPGMIAALQQLFSVMEYSPVRPHVSPAGVRNLLPTFFRNSF